MTSSLIDYDGKSDIEAGADEFASTRLISQDAYNEFIENADFSLDAIKIFAASQQIRPYMVIGGLQRERILSYNCYSSEKVRYQRA